MKQNQLTKTTLGGVNNDTPKMKAIERKSKSSKDLISSIDKQLSKPKRKSKADIKRDILKECGCL